MASKEPDNAASAAGRREAESLVMYDTPILVSTQAGKRTTTVLPSVKTAPTQ